VARAPAREPGLFVSASCIRGFGLQLQDTSPHLDVARHAHDTDASGDVIVTCREVSCPFTQVDALRVHALLVHVFCVEDV
jgi:hypothetical protein